MIKTTVQCLIDQGIIDEPMDGNHGELHPKASDYVDDGIPFLMANDIDGVVDLVNCHHISQEQAETLRKGFSIKDDVLITHKASIGRTAIMPDLRTSYAVLTPQVTYYRILRPDILNNSYLKYYFDSPYFQYTIKNRAGAGSTRAYIGIQQQHDLPIVYPPFSEQMKVVNVLDPIENKIRNNKKQSLVLDSICKLLYNYWFVQFDFPDINGKPYKSSGGKMTWNSDIKREIPEGWGVKTFSCCIKSINSGLNPRDNFKLNIGGEIKYLTVKNLTKEGTLDFSSCDLIDEKARNIVHRRSDIKKGDILFASIAPLGRCYLIVSEPEDWDINESVFSIRPNYENMVSSFLYMMFTSEEFVKKAEGNSAGSVFKGIRITELLDLLTIIPPKPVLDRFDETIKRLFVLKANLQLENQKLSDMRDFLLPMLMNGQIKFS